MKAKNANKKRETFIYIRKSNTITIPIDKKNMDTFILILKKPISHLPQITIHTPTITYIHSLISLYFSKQKAKRSRMTPAIPLLIFSS